MTSNGGATNCPTAANFGLNFGSDQVKLAPSRTCIPGGEHGASVSLGGAGQDNFVFHAGMAGTVANFHPQSDTIEVDNFPNIESVQQLAASITYDAHGGAPIELGHGDSVAPSGVGAAYLQAHLQSLAHLG